MKAPNILSHLFITLLLAIVSEPMYGAAEAPVTKTLFSGSVMLLVIGTLIVFLAAIVGLSRIAITLSRLALKAKNKTLLITLLLLMQFSIFAQGGEVLVVRKGLPEWAKDPNLYFVAFIVIILFFTVRTLYKVNLALIWHLHPESRPVTTEVVTARESLLQKLYKKLTASVPVAHEKDILLDHDYDGIKELDNKLPPWWIYGFYITILFGVLYLLHYHYLGTGKLQLEEYAEEVRIAEVEREERLRAESDRVTENNVVLLTDAARLAQGKETFEKMCAACHRPDGGGQVGPNLTDAYWIHGGGIRNVFKTVTYGVPAKGMISWKTQLSPRQIHEVSSYILTLEGSQPPNPKAPQGDLWVAENVVQDTSATRVDTTYRSL